MTPYQVILLILGVAGVLALLRRRKRAEAWSEMSLLETAGWGCMIPLSFVVVGGVVFAALAFLLIDSSESAKQQDQDFVKAAVAGFIAGAIASFWVIFKLSPKKDR